MDIGEAASCGVLDKLALRWLMAFGTLLPQGQDIPSQPHQYSQGIYLIMCRAPH